MTVGLLITVFMFPRQEDGGGEAVKHLYCMMICVLTSCNEGQIQKQKASSLKQITNNFSYTLKMCVEQAMILSL